MFTALEIAFYAVAALLACWILADALTMEKEDYDE